MDRDMERPQKRRRVETTAPEMAQSPESHSHVGTHAHSLTHLAHSDSSAGLRRHPDHIQEVHMRIQTRSRVDRRQLGVDVGVGVGGESVSVPAVSVPVSAGISASVGASASAGVQSGISAGVSVGISESVTDLLPTSSDGSAQVTSAPSLNTSSTSGGILSSSSSNTTASAYGSGLRNGTISMTQAPFRPNGTDIFLATVDGTTYTVSRGSQAYTTTFANGQVAVITPSSRKPTTSSSSQSTHADSSSSENDQNTATSSFAQISGAGVATQTTSSHSSTSTAAASNNDSSTPPAGTIAGGVVGGAAGLAVIILIAMIFLRWFRRRQQLGHHALPPNASPDPQGPSQSRSGPGMAERAGLTPLMGAVPAFFRHQNRSKEIAPAEGGERGFTRISGRKLPSQFSPGMTSSPPPAVPLTDPDVERTYNNNTSFYRDSNGYYGGEGTGVDRQPSDASSSHMFPLGTSPEHMVLSAGPQRRPTISQGGPYAVTRDQHQYQPPPHHYNTDDDFERAVGAVPSSYESHHGETYLGSRATFDRTETPSPVDTFYDPSAGHGARGSRFTEQV